MRTLLINGCSYSAIWKPSKVFVQKLGCDQIVNLGNPGTGFQRTCRTTVEWIAQNTNPEFVLIPITFCQRWELALNEKEDPIDGSWIPLQNSNFINKKYVVQGTTIEKLKSFVADYFKIIPTIKTYWDKIFTEIILLAGWLESRNINYLMFDMCNGFEMKHLKGYKGFEKIKFINENKKIINLFNFCGNKHMWNMLDNKNNVNFNTHHKPQQYLELERYLLNYLKI